MKRNGFTLIELLVVVVVIVVLIGLLLPAISWAQRQARVGATITDMRSIGIALSAYHTDFGIYPDSRVCDNLNGEYRNGSTWAIPPSRADIILAEALIGFLPASLDGDGNGFCVKPYKRVYGPYLSSGNGIAAVSNPNDPGVPLETLMDDFTPPNPIYYFSANTTPTSGYVFDSPHQDGVNAQGVPIMVEGIFDSEDNKLPFPDYTATMPVPTQKFLKSIGDSRGPTPGNDILWSGDRIKGANSYLLISAGPNGQYFSGDNVAVGAH